MLFVWGPSYFFFLPLSAVAVSLSLNVSNLYFSLKSRIDSDASIRVTIYINFVYYSVYYLSLYLFIFFIFSICLFFYILLSLLNILYVWHNYLASFGQYFVLPILAKITALNLLLTDEFGEYMGKGSDESFQILPILPSSSVHPTTFLWEVRGLGSPG